MGRCVGSPQAAPLPWIPQIEYSALIVDLPCGCWGAVYTRLARQALGTAMIHKSYVDGRQRNGSAETLIYLGKPSPPFGEAGTDSLSTDRQRWLLEGFLCAQ